jgi:hypothetical protein
MTDGPGGDRFRAEWLAVALPAVLAGHDAAGRPSTVGIAVDGQMIQVRTARSDVEVSPHDGRDPGAVVRADASVVLGLAAGALTVDAIGELIDIEGDEAAIRAVFNTRRAAPAATTAAARAAPAETKPGHPAP